MSISHLKNNILIRRYFKYIFIIVILCLFYMLFLFITEFARMEGNILNDKIPYFVNKSYFFHNFLIDII